MSGVIVDTSIAVKWVLNESLTATADALLADWLRAGLRPRVPSWFACEVANLLYQKVREGRLTLLDAQEGVTAIMAAVAVQDFDAAVAVRALELAMRFRQPASYDAHYLALAEVLDCDLWTADGRFWRAVQGRHPRIHWIEEATSA